MLWARCCPCACAARNTSAKATEAQKQANTAAGALHQEAAAQALACTLHAQAPAKKRKKPQGSAALLARPAANGEAAAAPAPVARKERSGIDDYILVRSDALAAESGSLWVPAAAGECTRCTSCATVHSGALQCQQAVCAPLLSPLQQASSASGHS